MAAQFKYIDEVLDYLHPKLDAEKSEIGLAQVLYGEDLVTEYPAAVLVGAPAIRTIHTTRTFKVEFRVQIFVYHADATQERQVRNREDLQLASRVIKSLHQDMTLGGHIVHGFIEVDAPGILSTTPGRFVVGTLLGWMGQSRVSFEEV